MRSLQETAADSSDEENVGPEDFTQVWGPGAQRTGHHRDNRTFK